MTSEEVEQAIATARDNRSTHLSFRLQKIEVMPESIGNHLNNLTALDMSHNKLISIPNSIGNLNRLRSSILALLLHDYH